MQVTVQNENTVVVDVQQQETIVVEVDQGRAGRGIQNITYTEVSGQYFLIVTYTDGTTETLGPLVVTGGAAFLLGGATGSIPYQSAPNTTVFLPIGTQNQVVVAGATAPQYTSSLTGLTVNNSAIGNTAPSTGAFTNLSASGTFALTGDQVQISEGGTGQTTANGAFNALAPSQTGNAGKYLKTDGTNSSWDQLDISTADITGTLPIANGGTGQTTANSALNALLPTQAAQSGKYLKTDGTNASWDQLDISTADITGVLPVANGGTGASTAAGARANLSAAILGTNNDITSLTGITGGISTPDFVQFDTTATEANAVGKVYWDASQGTLDLGLLGGNVVSRIGQSLVAYVTNAEAVTITKGQVVYLFGAQGDRATVKLAYNTSDATSAKTFGVVAENIGPNQTGFVMCQGVLEGLNLGAFTAGDTLYLGATPGSLTATKPYAPNHLVYVGLVERANAGNGQLYVKVQNGYELDEIHDVQIINPQNGQTILYDASTSLWKNANLTAGTGISVTNGAASVTIGNTGVLSFSGGTTGLTPATSTTGAVTLGGTLAVASGGTGATTAGGALTNLGAASSAITISAGTGLTGGGDLTANRTLSIANTTVTAASYGSASSVGTFTVNAQGQLTAAASTPIAIANTQVSGLGTMSTQNSNSVTITGGSITGITDLAIADGGTGASDAPTARTNLGLGTSATLNAGVALGVATLDAGGTVPLSQLPASIQGGVSYQGSWDASTNTPTIVSSVGTKGYYYVVSVAGSTNINGISDWLPGDWIIFNGSIWQKIDNTDAVASVNGYTGVVVLNAADVGAAPTSRTITAGTGLTGGGDLSANRTISIANTTVAAGSYGSASSVGTFTVNGQGQLTAAASTPIAITNTQVSGLGTMSTQNANAVAITGGSIDGTTIGGTTRAAGSFTTLTLTNALDIANGGTGQTTANAAFNALAPSQTGNAGKYLTTDGTNTSWATNPLGTVTSVDVSGGTTGLTTSGGPITSSGTITLGGTLATTNGGTGLTSFTANRVFYASSTSAIGQSANLTFDGTTLTAANFTDSSLTSGRVTYATTGGNLTDSANLLYSGTDLTVYGITVGRGAGAVSTNTAVGASALAANTTGTSNAAFGLSALAFNTTGTTNSAFGLFALRSNTTGSSNTAVGEEALWQNTTASNNTAVGYQAGYSNTTGDINAFGYRALYSNTTGTGSVAVGYQAAYSNTTGVRLVAIGQSALFSNTTGSDNLAIGQSALYFNTTGFYNVAIGGYGGAKQTMLDNTTGAYNTAVGMSALASNTTASNTTAVGYQAAYSNTTAATTTAVGSQALYSNTTGAENTAVGRVALYTNSTGGYNTATGLQALYSNTTGSYNTAFGNSALVNNTTASFNTAVGYQSMYSTQTGGTHAAVGFQSLYSITQNVAGSVGFGYQAGYSTSTGSVTALGAQSLYANTTGAYNVATGNSTLYANTTGNYNTAVGDQALRFNTTASENTAVGFQAAYSNTTGTGLAAFGPQALVSNTTGSFNSAFGGKDAFGYSPLGYNTTGSFNTAMGSGALNANTTGGANTAVGYQAAYTNATGTRITALGFQAAKGGAGSAPSYSVAVGSYALASVTTADSNTAVGDNAMALTTTGSANIAVGNGALYVNTTGFYNTALGVTALFNNTTASFNTAVGYQAAYSTTTGQTVDAFGYAALYSNTTGALNTGIGAASLFSNTTGSYNTAVGREALRSNTTASYNTAVGYQAGYSNTTGYFNTNIGVQAGFSVTTGYENTAVGFGAGYSQTTATGNTLIGRSAGEILTTGSYNTFVGGKNGSSGGFSGGLMTTGSRNTILGAFTGNQSGLDIRTSNNYIVLSDGDGNPRAYQNGGQWWFNSPSAAVAAADTTLITYGDLEIARDGVSGTQRHARFGSFGWTAYTGGFYAAVYSYNGSSYAFRNVIEGYPDVSGNNNYLLLPYGQLRFPATQNASSDANTLDDYEEGTFTPNILSDSTGFFTMTTQYGRYTKIGRVVTIQVYIAWSARPSGGNVTLTGFPFAINNGGTTGGNAATAFQVLSATDTVFMNQNLSFDGTIDAGTIYVYNFGRSTLLQVNSLSSSGFVAYSGIYYVS